MHSKMEARVEERSKISEPQSKPHLLDLPAEIRMQILSYVFPDDRTTSGFHTDVKLPGLILSPAYQTPSKLLPLLTCRQIQADAHLFALSRTLFICANLFVPLSSRLAELPSQNLRALKSIAFVADARHFRALADWNGSAGPFGLAAAGLELDDLTLVLHRSSCWHYLFDFTTDWVRLLRRLRGVKTLRVIRNGARVKGSFKTWFNRLVGLMMKVDHCERFLAERPCREEVWWGWEFDDEKQSFCFEARPPKPWMDEETYLCEMVPLLDDLRVSVEGEEWNPDPRSRNGA